jgi:hypothetical protein
MMRASCIAVLTALALAAGAPAAGAAESGKRDKPVTAAKKAKAAHQRSRMAARTAPRAAHGDGGVPRGPLYWGQDYLGDDPDPNIRSQILRDTGARFGGPE